MDRARQAGAMLHELQAATAEVAEIRRIAIAEAVAAGMSYGAIGEALGVTKSMIAKIHTEVLRRQLPGGPDDVVQQLAAGTASRITGGLQLPPRL